MFANNKPVTQSLHAVNSQPPLPERASAYAAIDNDRWKILQWATVTRRQGVVMNQDDALTFLMIQELREMKVLLKRLVAEYEQDEPEEE